MSADVSGPTPDKVCTVYPRRAIITAPKRVGDHAAVSVAKHGGIRREWKPEGFGTSSRGPPLPNAGLLVSSGLLLRLRPSSGREKEALYTRCLP